MPELPDATTIAQEVRARRMSAREVTEAAIARMEETEPALHAFCTPAPDLARARADEVDRELAAGGDPGPLAGVPVAIKDLICTKDLPTVSGSWAYEGFVPEDDDIVVARLRDAGAVILGKTNATEFGYSGASFNPVFPETRNPWDLTKTSGGSSAGSAAAVAAGVVPFAVGSDGGGSIRTPASMCGLVGIKASMGRVPLWPGTKDPRHPGVSSWESLEHIGPMSRTVADSALMLSVIAGPDPRDRMSLPPAGFDWMDALQGELRGLRVAYSADWGFATVDPEVRAIVGAAARVFADDLGCDVVEVDPGFGDEFAAFQGVIAADTDLRGMRAMAAELGERMSPHLRDFLAREWTAEDLTDALMGRKRVCEALARLMADHDLLLTPTAGTPAFDLGILGPEVIDGREVHPAHWGAFSFPLNFSGQPAASVPAGWTEAGLPVGLQIAGRHLDDALVLRACAAFEAAAPWAHRLPPM
ncbi:MAG: amidase [Solirubrobacteraceae bacterium]|nr:amidase [Solirubrobacteraceae bacterium]